MTTHKFQVGDLVGVRKTIKIPQNGWGCVTHQSIGRVTNLADSDDSPAMYVDFPEQHCWHAEPSEMVLVKAKEKPMKATNDSKLVCRSCSGEFPTGTSGVYYKDDWYCLDCVDQHFTRCSICGDLYPDWVDNCGNYCPSCSEGYFACEDCGSVCPMDKYADDGKCTDCYRKEEEPASYYKKPTGTVYRDGLPFGVDSKSGGSEYWVDEWGIDKDLSLCQEAADFYLLNSLSTDFPDDLDIAIARSVQLNNLADQFERYLIMVIGGELRHMKEHTSGEWEQAITEIPSVDSLIRNCCPLGSREDFWSEYWKPYVDKVGKIKAIGAAWLVFNYIGWGESYGGESWAKIAWVLLMYLKGQINKTVFVDTAWGMHHNEDLVFTKVWVCSKYLKHILNHNLIGNLKYFVCYASESVRELWEKRRGGNTNGISTARKAGKNKPSGD